MTKPIMFKWKKGRQNDSYKRFTLINFKRFDCHLIKIDKWAKIPLHKDLPKDEKYKHYRLNILLKGNYTQLYEHAPLWFKKRITLFRPDINTHGVGTADEEALILSIGWLKK